MQMSDRITIIQKSEQLDLTIILSWSFSLCALEVCAVSKKHRGRGEREGERDTGRERGGGGGGRKREKGDEIVG